MQPPLSQLSLESKPQHELQCAFSQRPTLHRELGIPQPVDAAVRVHHWRATDAVLGERLGRFVDRRVRAQGDGVRRHHVNRGHRQVPLVELLDLLEQHHQLVIVEHDPECRQRAGGCRQHPGAQRGLATQSLEQSGDVLA